uniref:HTH CENPB-type domain-containing protein n=1 Tax=Varanus komodoensis TaxID=61221 RepID=A0A8D2KY08_VARKO
MEEMGRLLSVWMQDQHQRRVPLSLMLMQERAKIPYEGFHGWFNRFKTRTNLHNVKVSGEAVTVGTATAENFLKCFEKLLMKAHIFLSRFLMWMRQDCTGRECQTEVTSVRRKS